MVRPETGLFVTFDLGDPAFVHGDLDGSKAQGFDLADDEIQPLGPCGAARGRGMRRLSFHRVGVTRFESVSRVFPRFGRGPDQGQMSGEKAVTISVKPARKPSAGFALRFISSGCVSVADAMNGGVTPSRRILRSVTSTTWPKL